MTERDSPVTALLDTIEDAINSDPNYEDGPRLHRAAFTALQALRAALASSDDVAGSGERLCHCSCDADHYESMHVATPTRLSSSIDDDSTQAPREETPEA